MGMTAMRREVRGLESIELIESGIMGESRT